MAWRLCKTRYLQLRGLILCLVDQFSSVHPPPAFLLAQSTAYCLPGTVGNVCIKGPQRKESSAVLPFIDVRPITSTAAATTANSLQVKVSSPGGQGISMSFRALRCVRGRVKNRDGEIGPAADGTRPWRIQRTRQQHIRGRSISHGRFLWDAPPAPIAAPAGSALWAALYWPILSWLPAPFPFRRRLPSSPKARMHAAFT